LPRIPGFEIQSELGRGAMGAVYLATETRLNRRVALKILPGAQGPDAGAGPRRRWLREARAVSSVRHPNVVPLYDYGEADGWFFLVLEYVGGGTLKQRLAEPLTPRVAAGLMETIARAVGYVHSRGLLHFDLKPSNILLDCEGNGPWERMTPRISDFGLAHSGGDAGASQTSLAGLRGTPSYMAPEQTTGSRDGVGAAADIHALGAILYELLIGRPPFQGTSMLETLDQVRGQSPVPPRRLNPKVPRDLETIALKCLEKSPARRYASADSLADDLMRFLSGRPITARPVSPVEHAWRWCHRQPLVATMAATLFLTVVGSFLGLLALLRRAEAQRSRSEANYQVAARSLDEIVGFLVNELMNEPLKYKGFDAKKILENVRAQEIELSKRYPLDIGGVKRLATIDNYLAHFYSRDGKQDEARSLLQEAIGHCEEYLAASPGDVDLQHRFFELVVCMLSDSARSGNDQLYEQCNARAIALLERLKSLPNVHVADFCQLSSYHRVRADYLMFRGESDRARKVLEKDLELVRSVPAPETTSREVVLSEALTLAALGRWSGEFTPLGSANHSQPPSLSIQDPERYLAELTARRLGWPPSIVKAPWLIPEDLPTEAWVDRAISSIEADAAKFHLDRARVPVVAWSLISPVEKVVAHQRHIGRLGEAHRIADRLLALAERLTRSYPDQAAAFMLLSGGYIQEAKNAYREDDAPVIKRWEQKALDAATQAQALEPENDGARYLVNHCRARLDKLASK
jgi:hypothetical protein